MVCGTRPFDGKTDQILFGKIQTGSYKQTGKYATLSPQCQDLISKVFTVDPEERINGQQALDHPWFAEFKLGRMLSCEVGVPDSQVLKKLATFKGESILKKAALNMVIKMTDGKELEELR